MRTLEQVSADEIKRADFIAAVDPERESSLTIWGDDVVPPMTPPGSPAHKVEVMEIECPAGDTATRDKIIDRVKSVRGRVSSRLPNQPR